MQSILDIFLINQLTRTRRDSNNHYKEKWVSLSILVCKIIRSFIIWCHILFSALSQQQQLSFGFHVLSGNPLAKHVQTHTQILCETHRYKNSQIRIRATSVVGSRTCGGLQSHKSTPATCWLQLLQNCISQTHSHSCRPKKERCIWGQRERASTCIYCDYTTFFLPTKSRRRRRRCDCCCGASGFFSRHLPIAAFAIRLWSRSGCQKNS